MTRRWKLHEVSYLFALPALLFYCSFVIYPALQSFYLALTNWNGLDPNYKFVGLQNFIGLLDESKFIAAIQNTLVFAIGLTLGQIVIGLILANLVNRGVKSDNLFRTLFFSPQVISLLATGYIWSYIFDPFNGSLNTILGKIGLSSLQNDWLGSLDLAIWSIISVGIWHGAGWCMVIFLANLQSIPKELYEATVIDGASSKQKFWYVTIPLLAPAFTITVVTGMIAGLKTFDLVMTMTKGGPGYATQSISSVMYLTAFTSNKFGEATAMGIVMFLAILFITACQLMILKKREVEM
ncbi:carbohydrate ABC transporter permease [Paenibacillus eucommiae]|uniref:ABC-type sugar transport system permease subunit n=1 Tax=Paenibacillus eucommiae TaxID=1355755 RepID=A0ABS4JAG1_9BACL|nr:sugar ABC transporter permease [Paenibacillus eucommiae]MBP1996833.1 ABC-type sugar transport system permease subunit [Paenibacillus eucommiae]